MSLPFVASSLLVVRFDVLDVALLPTSVKTARPTFVLGAWSLPLVMPNTTAPLHVAIRVHLLVVTILLGTTISKILGSEMVLQLYNGGNVTE